MRNMRDKYYDEAIKSGSIYRVNGMIEDDLVSSFKEGDLVLVVLKHTEKNIHRAANMSLGVVKKIDDKLTIVLDREMLFFDDSYLKKICVDDLFSMFNEYNSKTSSLDIYILSDFLTEKQKEKLLGYLCNEETDSECKLLINDDFTAFAIMHPAFTFNMKYDGGTDNIVFSVRVDRYSYGFYDSRNSGLLNNELSRCEFIYCHKSGLPIILKVDSTYLVITHNRYGSKWPVRVDTFGTADEAWASLVNDIYSDPHQQPFAPINMF